MFCTRCGAQNSDEATFCTSCGSTLKKAGESEPAPSTQTIAPDKSPAGTPIATPSGTSKAKPKKQAIIIAVACVAILLVAGIGFFACTQMKKSEIEHGTAPVWLSFFYSGDYDEMPIGIPILIEGTDLDGKHVEKRVLADWDGGDFDLAAGSYIVSVAGQPVGSNGTVFNVTGEKSQTLEIPVPGPDGENAPGSFTYQLQYSLKPAVIGTLTDEQIEAIKEWLSAYDIDASEAETILSKIVDARDEVVAKEKLEEEKQAALAANPILINNGSSGQITGTVNVGTFTGRNTEGSVTVYYLTLPREVTTYPEGTTKQTWNKVRLNDSFSSYLGQTITISASYTSVYDRTAYNACSSIQAVNPQIVRDFG